VAEIKLTKNELRNQQVRLAQLEKYLPTLQLKKAMLQSQVYEARSELNRLKGVFNEKRTKLESYSALLSERTSIDPLKVIKVKNIVKRYENVAGVEIPTYESVEFEDFTYNLFETPPWVDAAIIGLRALAEAGIHIQVVEEEIRALEKELREVSIRVNLFEKILIPRAVANIKKIKVFLGDQQLAAVSQAKVAKEKIEAAKETAFLARLKEISNES
jgi:V/A-type H+-transporting ATPase subunit D